jgi:hypothetical protein
MRAEDKIGFIREKATEHAPEGHEKILWSSHAVKKLRVEGLRKQDVEGCLKECTMVEDYAMERRPLPGCLVLGFVGEIPLHCVIAIDRDFDRMVIVTAYRPAKEKWDDDWQKRKK